MQLPASWSPPTAPGLIFFLRIMTPFSYQKVFTSSRWKLGEVTDLGVFYSSFGAKGIRFGTFQHKVVNTSEVKMHNSLIHGRSLKTVIWATLLTEKEVQGTGHPMSAVPISRWSRTLWPHYVKGRSFMKAIRRPTRAKSSSCGMEIARRSLWIFRWAYRL